MGILDRNSEEHTHEDGTTHSHEGGDKPHTHDCTCTEQGRDIICSEHGG
jgi:hypothetical protein|tara:strand:- start:188 stop:334 length:147 start_codon:yes stop_codon:yes gene_type:complete